MVALLGAGGFRGILAPVTLRVPGLALVQFGRGYVLLGLRWRWQVG